MFIESEEAVSVSAADITLYHHRGNTVSGQDADVLSSILFQGNNDASTPEQILFGAVEASIVDASDTTEDGKLDLKVQAAGTLTSMAAITAAKRHSWKSSSLANTYTCIRQCCWYGRRGGMGRKLHLYLYCHQYLETGCHFDMVVMAVALAGG